MTKKFTVASQVQKAVFEKILLNELSDGFWKMAKPKDHAEVWNNVEILVSTATGTVGAVGFASARNYNFVNPEFYKKNENALLAAAQEVDPLITPKSLKKHLIQLNQIIGARQEKADGPVTKLSRGRKNSGTSETKTDSSRMQRAKATFIDPTPEEISDTPEEISDLTTDVEQISDLTIESEDTAK